MDSRSDPLLECDLVMKGGITSGVVYPLAVVELAEVYRLRSVGGSSAGAIAAAAAACAELGRAGGGFERLAALPHDLGERGSSGRSRLFTLFQPLPSMRRLFRLVTAGLGTTGRGRATAMVLAALLAWLPYAALGAAAGVLLAVLGFLAGGPAQWVCLVAGLVVALVGLAAGTAYGVVRDVARLPEVGFGLCSGLSQPGSTGSALTPWLHETFQALAGRTTADPPVTFGELADAGITLKLMTTNLSRRQPLALPWETHQHTFDPAEMRALFPEDVVRQLERGAALVGGGPDARTDDRLEELDRLQARPLLPFPDGSDVPVVVGVRMSLSFPGLIAAVPLHAVDFSLEANHRARTAARDWLRTHPDASAEQAAAAVPALTWQRNWFSDGGICANLPLHFFDSALPRRPTFAIDLAEFPVDRAKQADERDNSYLPVTNSAGLLRVQTVWPRSGLGAVVGFVVSLVDTARTWVDEAQLSMPGYRDRIVTVFHEGSEGGLNLDMGERTVDALSQRGQGAARRLVDRFAGAHPGVVPAAGWDNHRWVRFRTASASFSDTLDSFRTGYDAEPLGTTPYAEWVGVAEDGREADAPLPSYPVTGKRRHAVNLRTAGLLDTAREWESDPADAFTRGAPEPRPRTRLAPTDGAGDALPPA